MVMMIVLHDLSSFHYVAVLSRNKVEEDLIVVVVRNTIVENLPSLSPPHPTADTHNCCGVYHRRRQYVAMGDNICRKTRYIFFRRREYMPYDICPATKYAATRTASWR